MESHFDTESYITQKLLNTKLLIYLLYNLVLLVSERERESLINKMSI